MDQAVEQLGDPALRYLLSRVADAGFGDLPIARAVRASWLRAAAAGLRPELIHPPYDADVDDHSKVHWAAAPVMSAVAADLPDLRAALLLTDPRSHVIDRWTRTPRTAVQVDAVGAAPGFFCDEATVGTTSIGLSAVTRRRALICGFEHYADAFTHITCASEAVLDPYTGQLLGVVNLTVADPAPWELMSALVGRVVHETEQRLVDEAGSRSIPVQRTLRPGGRVAAKPVARGEESGGWARLTQSERTVAELVANGLTNREVAATLFLSPHTVDYHLRHVFGKLDIDSRVQLARIAVRNLDLPDGGRH